MKKIQNLFGIALCGFILGTACTAYADATKAGYATVVRVEGMVSYTLGDDVWHPLVPGKFLPAGASIRTGENGVADLVLGQSVQFPQVSSGAPSRITLSADSPVTGMASYKPAVAQNTVRLTPNTVLTVDKLMTTDTGADTVGDTELDLKKGTIFASVKKLSAASQYNIKIPNGIAGVRGTDLKITAEDGSVAVFQTHGNDGVLLVLTLPGSTQPTTYVINTGESCNSTGQKVAISPAVMQILKDIFAQIDTTKKETLNYDLDHTQVYVSPNR